MGKDVNTPLTDVHLDKRSRLCAFYTRASCSSQNEVQGFLYWDVCSCTSHLFGIPQLSSPCLPCFRPCAWLTCPSSSELLNSTPPWNHQLQSSDLPDPVCFSMKLPPGSLTFHLCLMHLQCRVVVSLAPQDVPCQSGILWSAGSWVGKAGCPGTVWCPHCSFFKRALLGCMWFPGAFGAPHHSLLAGGDGLWCLLSFLRFRYSTSQTLGWNIDGGRLMDKHI